MGGGVGVSCELLRQCLADEDWGPPSPAMLASTGFAARYQQALETCRHRARRVFGKERAVQPSPGPWLPLKAV